MAIEGVDSFPLYWPEGWRRSKHQQPGAYQVSLARARDDLIDTLRKMKAIEYVISTNVPIRRDGLPAANMPEPLDVGAAVYWKTTKIVNGESQATVNTIACDKWRLVQENVRAIGLALEAMRALERSGASQAFERATQAFAMLPPGPKIREWRELFYGQRAPRDILLADVEQLYKQKARECHPDNILTGSQEAMQELNRAMAQARQELSEGTSR